MVPGLVAGWIYIVIVTIAYELGAAVRPTQRLKDRQMLPIETR